MPVAKRKAAELDEPSVDWEHLPPTVLELVIALLPHHEDLAHAGQVCQRWRECLLYSDVVWLEQLTRQGWAGGDDGGTPLRRVFLQRQHWRTLCYQCGAPCERILGVGPLKVRVCILAHSVPGRGTYSRSRVSSPRRQENLGHPAPAPAHSTDTSDTSLEEGAWQGWVRSRGVLLACTGHAAAHELFQRPAQPKANGPRGHQDARQFTILRAGQGLRAAAVRGALKRKSRSRETALSKTDVLILPSSAPITLLQLLGLRHRRSQRSIAWH